MKKRLLACTAILCAILFSLTVAHAEVTPHALTKATLEFDGTKAICKFSRTYVCGTISATMELWCGNAPEVIWTGRDKNTLKMSKTHTVRRGQTYTLKVFCTVNGETTKLPPHHQNLSLSNPQQ